VNVFDVIASLLHVIASVLHVIASAAKQSILPLRGKMDCFAAAPWRPGPN